MTTLLTELRRAFDQNDTELNYECIAYITLKEYIAILKPFYMELHGKTAVAYMTSWVTSKEYLSSAKLKLLYSSPDEVDWLIEAMELCYSTSKHIDSSLTHPFSDETVNELFNFYIKSTSDYPVELVKHDSHWSIVRV